MKVIKLLSVLLLSLFVFKNISAQSLIVDREYFNYDIKIKYESNQAKEDLPNFFVDQIARSIPKHFLATNYSARINLELILSKKSKSEYSIKLKNNSFLYSGDYKYKGFDVKNIIFPKKLITNIKLVDLNSQSEYSLEIISFVDFSKTYLIDTLIVDTSLSKSYNIKSADIEFDFHKSQKEDFIRMQTAVDKYENSGFTIKNLKQKIGDIKLNQPSMTPIYKMKIAEIKSELEEINPENFYHDFENLKKDPLNLFREYRYMNDKLNKLDSLLDLQMTQMDSAYYQKGLQEYKVANYSNAKAYLDLALKNNPYKSDAVLLLAKIDLKTNRTDSALAKLIFILNELMPKADVKKEIIAFSDIAISRATDDAANLIANDQFTNAVELLDLAMKLCENSLIECDSKLDNLMSKAKYGFFNSYLEIAERAISRNRPDLAIEYINTAEEFQQKNSDYIIGNAQVVKLKDRIFVDFENSILQNLNDNNYSVALKQIESLNDFIKKNNLNSKQDKYIELKSKIHQAIFNQMLAKAADVKRQSGVQASEIYVNDALLYQENFREFVKISYENERIIKSVKSEALLKNISQIQNLIEEGDETQARLKLKQMLNFENYLTDESKKTVDKLRFQLKDEFLDSLIIKSDSLISMQNYFDAKNVLQNAIQLAKEKRPDYVRTLNAKMDFIEVKLCQQFTDSTDALFENYQTNLNSNEFLTALEIYRKINLLKLKVDCEFNLDFKENEIQELVRIEKYFIFKGKMDSLWLIKDYHNFIIHYKKADSIFNSLRYYRSEISHINYSRFFEDKIQNTDFVFQDLKYQIDNNNLETSFFHLDLLFRKNNSKPICHEIYQKIMINLIEHDINKRGYEKAKYGINLHFNSPELRENRILIKLYKYHWAIKNNKRLQILKYQITDNKLISCY